MNAPPAFVQSLCEALEPWAPVQVSRFFGGHQLRRDGRQLAIVIKGQLWLRADAALAAALLQAGGGTPFRYAGASGREVIVGRYRSPPPQALDDPDALRQWCRRAWDAAADAPGSRKPPGASPRAAAKLRRPASSAPR